MSNSQAISDGHSSGLSDFDLLHRLRKRDAAALRALHERYAGFVTSIAHGVLGEAEASERITQDVFIHLWSQGFYPEEQRGRFLSWLFFLTRTRATEARRANRHGSESGADRARSVPLLKRARSGSDDLASRPLRKEERRRVQEVLEGLSDSERMIIQLSFFDGLTHTEIAAELAAPLEEVRCRLRDAVDQVQSGLAQMPAGSAAAESAGESLEALAGVYAMGALDGESLHVFEARLSEGDTELWDRVREFESTTDALAQWVTAMPVREDAFDSLETRMTEEGFLRARAEDDFDSGLLSMRRVAALSVVLAVLGLGYAAYRLDEERRLALSNLAFSEQGRADLGRELAATKEFVSDLESRNRQLELAQVDQEQAFAAVTRPVPGRDWELEPISKDLEVKARAFLDVPTGRVFVSVDSLPILPTEQAYQLWLIMEDEPVDGGIIGSGGEVIRAESSAAAPTDPPPARGKLRMAITIEPASGSPLPTGPMILSGSG